MRTEAIRTCDICCGVGASPVECYGVNGETGLRYYRAKPDAKPCTKCGGQGERLVTVTDEREKRDESMDHRERMQDNADFVRSQEMYR